MKKVLITGANSYIGMSFESYVKETYKEELEIETLDMLNPSWRETDFSSYDTIFHVAGIAHADVGKVSEEVKKKYYEVNTNLAVEVAEKAKNEGTKQFVLMSSMIIYGESAPYGKAKEITRDTVPSPANFYGDSKFQADVKVQEFATDTFKVVVVRAPMIYGKNSKGNYPLLDKLAKKLPLFPNVENARSMLYIENLCEFLCCVMIKECSGVYFPQNREHVKTADLVKVIAAVAGHKIWVSKVFNPLVWCASKVPGKISGLANKAFGNMTYALELSEYTDMDYQKYDLEESIRHIEGK